MAVQRVALSTYQASNVDILNTIRQNANYEYQTSIPIMTSQEEVVKVGETIFGYPAFANYFLTSFLQRIALVKIRSAMFNNPYAELKKGYLTYGATVEESFVELCKAREINPAKSEERELKITPLDIRTAFHTINYRAQYPLTVFYTRMREAFLSEYGLSELVATIMDTPYRSNEYDEFLLFKYLIIKGYNAAKHGAVNYTGDITQGAIQMRALSNDLTFISTKYNSSGVHTVTPRDDQYIFMDSFYNAQFDVEVLAGAFNMDKATFLGHLKLIDSFTTFDNDRFSELVADGQMTAVTDEELAAMADVKAIIFDKEWFQIYDLQTTLTEKEVASGEYWNYFLNIKKIISWSPFSNMVSVTNTVITDLASLKFTVDSISESENALVITVVSEDGVSGYSFESNKNMVTQGIALHPYGGFMIPTDQTAVPMFPSVQFNGLSYTAPTAGITPSTLSVGDTLTFTKSN